MKTFKHSGATGDVIFSLPTIQLMGGGILYLPEHTTIRQGLYSNLKPLLEKQPYIHEVRELESWLPPGSKVEGIDVDLDKHLTHPWRGLTNMVKRYFDVFGLKGEWQKPWLDVGASNDMGYSLINVTPRFRDNSRVDWKVVYERIGGAAFFVGTDDEHAVFCREVAAVPRLACPTAYELAMVVAGAERIYCNQSLVLALAQAMGKQYWCEFKPKKTNCRFYTSNEHELR